MAQGPSPAERRQIESVLDRIEDRLREAAPGWHEVGPGADERTLHASAIPASARSLWARWDGLELAHGETTILPLSGVSAATAQAREAERIGVGDVVIGERGRDLLVLAADPWEEGADVVLVDDDGERGPYASSVPHLVLGVLGELDVLFDAEGEFRDELFGDDGELTGRAERKLLRRRLDLDPDAPLARFRLGQLLRRSGEFRGAIAELKAVVKRAPAYAWAQFELGRALWGVEPAKAAAAEGAFAAAARAAADPGLRGLLLAWAAHVSGGARRTEHASASLTAYPGLPAAHEAGAREAFASGELERARELVALGLAVSPRHVGLLALVRELDQGSGPGSV